MYPNYDGLIVYTVFITLITFAAIVVIFFLEKEIEDQIKILNKLCAETGYFISSAEPISIEKNPDAFITYLTRHGFHNPAVVDDEPTFNVIDRDLDLLLNLSADLVKGKCHMEIMDTGLWWMETLDQVLDRMNPQNAPHHNGEILKKELS